MCIIVAKPAGVEFPSQETLETCWMGNPDGAGIMWANGENVEIRKGFMTWESFLKAFKSVKAEVGTEGACVMHFRIATHGEVSPECCHPFPLTGDLEAMRKSTSRPKVGIAHNGIISGRKTDKRTSDTMDYIANVVYPLSRLCDEWYDNKYASKMIEDTLGSKMCVLLPDGNIKTFGEFIMDGGCYYSNSSFRGYRFGAYTYGYGYDYSKDFVTAKEKVYDVCEWCEFYDDCRYFGCACMDEEEAVEYALEGWDEKAVKAVLGKDYEALNEANAPDEELVEDIDDDVCVTLYSVGDDSVKQTCGKHSAKVYGDNWWKNQLGCGDSE